MVSVVVRVIAGPDTGRCVDLTRGAITVGRGASEDLQLSDGAVSRHHLTLDLDDQGHPRLVELSGVNPVWTLVNAERVNLTSGYILSPGTRITLGNTTLEIETTVPDSAEPPRPTLELEEALVLRPQFPRRLSALAALGDRLARCNSLQALFREATTWAISALPATRALLLSADGSDVLAASTDASVADLAVSRALLARVRTERRAFLVRDVLAEPDLADRRSVQLRGIAGAMAAPAKQLVFYAEWGIAEAASGRHDEETLLLLLCAAHLVSALSDSASERAQLRAAVSRHRGGDPTRERMLGASEAMQRLQVFMERVGPTPATVLLQGESGTGKELVATLLHGLSNVAAGPLVAINCAAIPESLLESELFGHEKGAFTGAVAEHDGVFVRAHGGTLFLDEIGEMSLTAQVRLLRVLETRRITRVGGTREQAVEVRLVAATHRDLRQRVEQGLFREDLYYRLSVIQTRLPPLRERGEDIPALVDHFAGQLAQQIGRRIERIAPEALETLQRYPWPGNVRELRNVVERALVLGDGGELQLDDLPPELLGAGVGTLATAPADPVTRPARVIPLAELERTAIAQALATTKGNKARAAALLGIDRTTLYRKLKDHALGE